MATIFGKAPKEYTAVAVWETKKIKTLRDVYGIQEGESDHVIVLDNTCLCYEKYGVELAEDRIRVWGSYRSFEKAFCKFMEMLWSNRDLTEADSLTGTIDLPKAPITRKEDLLKLLKHLPTDNRMLYGQHLSGSIEVNEMIDDYTVAVGDAPSILDFDMICLRKQPRGAWSRALCELVEYAAKGGVITTMHHWLNPVHPESDTYRGSADGIDNWNAILTRGTELNKEWHLELDRGAEFLAALHAAGVTFMFRPLHEANGGWFWFGAKEDIGAEELRRMWKYVYHYYVDECGLTNMLFSYGPNASEMKEYSPKSARFYYPGDEYCDVVGCDWYSGGNDYYEIESDVYEGNTYDRLAEYGKPFGLMEWGLDGNGNRLKLNCDDLVAMLKRMASEGKRIAFAEIYGGGFGAPSVIGRGEALMEYEPILTLSEMPAYISNVLN